jgi:hypothetical protein
MRPKAEEAINIYGETYGIVLRLSIEDAEQLSMGISNSYIKSALSEALELSRKRQQDTPSTL